MTRGNQRDTDRARALARHAGKGEAKEGNPEARRLQDGLLLQAKVEAKRKAEAEEAERKAAAYAFAKAAGQIPVEKAPASAPAPAPEVKKKKKTDEDLSFLNAAVNMRPK